MNRPQTFTKVDLKPKRYHGYAVLLFIFGTLFPPLAVAARFGIGSDFWLNLLLTICGYFPGHGHNFYIQNIRNNKNHQRTPKWVQKYGLVDTSEIKRKERRSQWASRYAERLPHSTLEDQPYEEGQGSGSRTTLSTEDGDARGRNNNGEYWNPNEERYYGQNGDPSSESVRSSGSGGRWHYPANFEDAVPEPTRKKSKKKKSKDKKDRWARTEDAYSIGETDAPRRKKSKKRRDATLDQDTYSRQSGSTTEFPEDPEGGLYGDTRRGEPAADANRRDEGDDIFTHQF